MKTLTTFLFLALSYFSFGQSKQDTINHLQEQTKIYMTEMYIKKNFNGATNMWDKRMFLEMEDFYQKRKQERLTDTVLSARIKADVSKYFEALKSFKIGKTIGSNLIRENQFIVGQIFFEYTETTKVKSQTVKTMIVFISEDKGKTWVIQDRKIKDIADKVDKKIL